ncbi:unnamed protein product [Cladocopium goreaui]|uniref:Uncharacterized protein n=1 Tax=Cladocopium goreaui TaxID=2562237 RepID=A0A9P1C9F7_9DINO|nr:unnamed protein product [Cladocopium goreaui]
MQRFSIFHVLLCFGLVAGQDFRQKKCDFIRREMEGGHKEWMKHQGWYKRLARLCNLPMDEAPMSSMPMIMARPAQSSSMEMRMPMQMQVPSQVSGGLQNAIGWAKQAAASPAGEELKDDAKKLAEKAKTAFEHQDTQELKEGAAEFMNNIKTLWEKNTDEATKKKAALLIGKAEKLLSGKAKEELATGLKLAHVAEKQIEGAPEAKMAKEFLKNSDVAKKVFDQLPKSGFDPKQAEELAAVAKKNLEKYGGSVQV